jgi:hypothetical protein
VRASQRPISAETLRPVATAGAPSARLIFSLIRSIALRVESLDRPRRRAASSCERGSSVGGRGMHPIELLVTDVELGRSVRRAT